MNERRTFLQTLLLSALASGVGSETDAAAQTTGAGQPAGGARQLQRQPLPDKFAGMDAAFAEITIQPGAQSRAHRHSGFVLGYVIEGDFLFAVNGEPPRTVHAGEIFYEPPGATHTTSGSANPDRPVKLLAIVVGPQGAAITLPEK